MLFWIVLIEELIIGPLKICFCVFEWVMDLGLADIMNGEVVIQCPRCVRTSLTSSVLDSLSESFEPQLIHALILRFLELNIYFSVVTESLPRLIGVFLCIFLYLILYLNQPVDMKEVCQVNQKRKHSCSRKRIVVVVPYRI